MWIPVVTWASWYLKSPVTRLIFQQLSQIHAEAFAPHEMMAQSYVSKLHHCVNEMLSDNEVLSPKALMKAVIWHLFLVYI